MMAKVVLFGLCTSLFLLVCSFKSLACTDNDGDGWTTDCGVTNKRDCDDSNPSIYASIPCPYPVEDSPYCVSATQCMGMSGCIITLLPDSICDGRDDNCNGQIDEGCDRDGDGYCTGTVSGTVAKCPNGGGDCNDLNYPSKEFSASIHPGRQEIPNCIDDDCDGKADDDFDLDGDGYTTVPCEGSSCTSCSSYGIRGSGDCNDADPSVNPRKDEVCNFKDDDCDGSVDECDTVVYDAQGNRRTVGTGSCVYFPSPGCQMTVDQDGDGFYLFNSGSQEASTSALPGTCYEAGTFSMSEGTESKVVDYCYTNYPTDSSEQTCNACLDSCISDPNCACYGDTQYDDGYSFTYRYCDRTKLTTICPSCQETRLNCAYAKLPVCTDEVRTENCNDGEDNDGNGISDCADSDCKDASVCRNDCNDQNAIVYPGADEICNGMDDDCDGIMLDNEHDSDGDGISACFDRNDDEGDPAYPLSPDGAYYSIANANLLGWSVGQ